ncbi:MAG: metal-dependent transcriptional regulator [Oscillospiraceae bacterium]|nr:metal-dependent transcriptional regulator [Oscillospiraceae bacterium]
MTKISNESREDYLEAIYLLTEQTGGAVRSVRLAEFMELSKASICKAVAGLKEEGSIYMGTNNLIALTATGMDEAKRVYRKHRYFESQLVAAGVDSETASAEACRMEHAISDNSFEKLLRLTSQRTADESEVVEG